MALRIAVNSEFRFLNKFFAQKMDDEKVQFLVMIFGKKNCLFNTWIREA